MKKIGAILVMLALLGLSVVYYRRTYSEVAEVFSNASDKQIVKVVIDPGHGGNDPGGIGVSGVLEKDVNLSGLEGLGEYIWRNQPLLFLLLS